jgi:NAD(P)-dependent dehydrogenase (short-subunit alcohol dehydrogenase family)
VQAVGVELAAHNVQVNAIPGRGQSDLLPRRGSGESAFRGARRSPARAHGAREDADFAGYLSSDAANCFVGQVFPVCGGWVAR